MKKVGEDPLNRERKTKEGERIRTLRRGEESAHFNMLNLAYAPWGSEEEWRRRYALHSDFDVAENVLIVEENGEWAGGGTAWFREALLKNDRKIVVYGAGDLYVHPDHRGKGVYSTAMRGLNELAQKRGAILGFAYPSIYRLPAMALPKYGFVEVFYPSTCVLVLKPDKFFQFLVARAKKAFLPEKFNGIKLRLVVSFDTPNGKREIDGVFLVEKGQINELKEPQNNERVDLTVKTEIGVLLKVVSSFFLGKRRLILLLLAATLKRRLRFRFSMKIIRAFLGL